MKKLFHGLAHAGLITLSVASAAGWLAPPPFNIIIIAGATTAQGILAMAHHTVPQVTTIGVDNPYIGKGKQS